MKHKLIFPRPFAIAIDDLGWMQGTNDGEDGYGPYRLGINRKTTLDDYKALVNLAKKVGVRLQGLFIMGEMDRENIVGQLPHATYLRDKWNNDQNVSDLQIQMMDLVKEQSAHLEFGLHGVGHEFWPAEGIRRRAEWYNTDDDHPWPEEEIRSHVECFIDIMKQYGISHEYGHSFPQSFVPCAYSYYWNPNGAYSLGSVLSEYGVKYANTDFTQIPECNPPQGDNVAGFDHGVHVMNRYNYGNLWHALNKLPEVGIDDQKTDYIETHWPNLLADNNSGQESVNQKWANYFLEVQQREDRYFSKNTAQHHAQWLYKEYTVIEEDQSGIVSIDNTRMPDLKGTNLNPGNLVLKIRLQPGQHVASAQINGRNIPAYFEEAGFGFLYLPWLHAKKYELTYKLSDHLPYNMVWHDGTSNILETEIKSEEINIQLIQYGNQPIKLLTHRQPEQVLSNNPDVEVQDWYVEDKLVRIELKARDMQGEQATVKIIF